MADYYPLIARAIAGLDPNAPGESRRALYERARAALIAQLRGVEPPLSESEITRERLSLEEAVRRVESEAAQRARDATRSPDTARTGSRAGDAFRASAGARPNAKPGEASAAHSGLESSAPRPRPPLPPQPRTERPPLGQEDRAEAQDQRSPRNLRPDAPRSPQPPVPGVRGFRDITADADDLGRAAAQASRAARKTYANVPSPTPEFDRQEPSMENRGADPDAPYSYDESVEEAERYAPRPRPMQGKGREAKRARSGAVFPFKSAIAVGVVLILVGAGILWGKSAVTAVIGLLKPASQVVEAPKDASAPQTKPKIPDRVGQPSSTDQVAPIAQRVVLYDEDPSDPKGKQYVGSVIWRTEQIKASGNQKADIAVRADIEIPDRKFKMTMSFRRNTDSSLPASHTAELTFVLPPDFSGGSVEGQLRGVACGQ